ncbi:MAG TPA: hypothetical protein VIP10_04800 [Burkholderiaceae bacterium]
MTRVPDPPKGDPEAPAPLPPLTSPMPRSDQLDREEPEFVDEPDLPKPDDASESAAGEEDPGAALDLPDPSR